MADEARTNLEPIEEKDLDLKEKFVGGAGEENKAVSPEAPKARIEEMHSIENPVERKEGAPEKEAAYTKILSKVKSQPVAPVPVNVETDAKEANQGMDAETKVQNLVKLAEVKGIPHAVKVARHMEDNYALDEFHDRLLGEELHDALVKKGLIKEI